jgi:8-oxo-dGTP pyrophosphatase MutT (NUDIX family)
MPWRITESKLLVRTPVFSLRQNRKRRVEGDARSHDFYLLEAVDWVNVVPVTEAGEIVFIELYRHGIEAPSLEIPGGMIDSEDADPAAAAAREMREETGYEAERLLSLGMVHPNPAIQANRCHTFLAEKARRVGDLRPDETEDIRVVLHPVHEVPLLLREGRITHALVVAGLYWYLQRGGT